MEQTDKGGKSSAPTKVVAFSFGKQRRIIMALSNLFGWNKMVKEAPASACGAACGASDKPEETPAACGTACGASDKPEEAPAACGTACGAGDK
jgi:ACGX-repeat protein